MNRQQLFVIVAFSALILLGLSCCGLSRLPLPPWRLSLDLQAPSAEQLRDRLTVKIKGSELRLSQGEGCTAGASQIFVPANTACVFGLPISAGSTRQLVLLASGSAGKVSLHLTQPQYLRVDQVLKYGDPPARLDVYSNPHGGEATLTLQGCEPAKLPGFEAEGCFLDIGK